MRNNDKVNAFTDLAEHGFLHQPHVIIKAEDITYNLVYEEADRYLATGRTRDVIYEDDSGNKRYLELVPYVHPVGAANITLGTLATAGSGVVTYTPSAEGFMLSEAGVLIPIAGISAIDVAGVLFADYYYNFNDNLNQREHGRATVIEEGDLLWLIRAGRWELASSAAVTDDDMLIVSTATAGKVMSAGAINTGGTIGDFNTSLRKQILGDASPTYGLALAQARATIGAAGLVDADIRLPRRFRR